ncbi:MAG: signal peptidase I [Patescibacteria group bacterium]|jgi:signal peptidase I
METNWHKIQSYVRKTVFILANFLLIAFFTRFFIIEPGRVSGTSMEPNYKNNEFFLVNKVALLFREPERFEVVQVVDQYNSNQLLVKRVIGLPGDIMLLKNNRVYINGELLDEPYLDESVSTKPAYSTDTKFVISPDYYFLLGDNRTLSRDSREFGPIHRSMIIGKAIK